jgi:hypothetical protein
MGRFSYRRAAGSGPIGVVGSGLSDRALCTGVELLDEGADGDTATAGATGICDGARTDAARRTTTNLGAAGDDDATGSDR